MLFMIVSILEYFTAKFILFNKMPSEQAIRIISSTIDCRKSKSIKIHNLIIFYSRKLFLFSISLNNQLKHFAYEYISHMSLFDNILLLKFIPYYKMPSEQAISFMYWLPIEQHNHGDTGFVYNILITNLNICFINAFHDCFYFRIFYC